MGVEGLRLACFYLSLISLQSHTPMPTVRNRCRERGQTEDRWLVQVLSVALGLGHAAGKALESLPLEGAAACAH